MAHNDARQTLIQNKVQQSEQSQKGLKRIVFQEKQKVFLKREDTSKLDDVNEGPFEVIEDLGPNIIILRNGRIETVHKNRSILFKE